MSSDAKPLGEWASAVSDDFWLAVQNSIIPEPIGSMKRADSAKIQLAAQVALRGNLWLKGDGKGGSDVVALHCYST